MPDLINQDRLLKCSFVPEDAEFEEEEVNLDKLREGLHVAVVVGDEILLGVVSSFVQEENVQVQLRKPAAYDEQAGWASIGQEHSNDSQNQGKQISKNRVSPLRLLRFQGETKAPS